MAETSHGRAAVLGRAAGAALFLALGACEEMRTPPPPEPPSLLSGGNATAPLFGMAQLAERGFAPEGPGVSGPPAEAILAAARLEWLAGEARPGRRLSTLDQDFRFALARAIEEQRAALGLAASASPEEAVAALLAAHRALAEGNAAAAEAALVPPAFQAGLRPSAMQRLAEPGPRPNAQIVLPPLVAALTPQAGAPRLEGGPGFGINDGGLPVFTTPRGAGR
jgi:hypothetical protein